MKRNLLILCLFLISVNSSNAQQYKWQALPQSVACLDSTLGGPCYVSNLLSDTVHHLLWIAGKFWWGDGVPGQSGANFAAWDGSKFVQNPLSKSSADGLNDWIMYNGNIVFAWNNGIVSMHNFTTGKGISLGTTSGEVYCLGIYNGDLIAGGNFYSINGVAVNSIARWDGSKWHPLGGGVSGSAYIVWALKEYKGELYAGGGVEKAGNTDAWNIARWNGSAWNQVGGIGTDVNSGDHLGANVFCMTVFQNNLYIAGRYDIVCGIKTHLAYWDGSKWTGTTYPEPETREISSNDTAIFLIHPYYPEIDSWNGTRKAVVDSAFNSGVGQAVSFDGAVYAGGWFDASGHTPCFRLARLMLDTTYDNVTMLHSGTSEVKVYPNPVRDKLAVGNWQLAKSEIEIRNMLGQKVPVKTVTAPSYRTEIDVSSLMQGIYFIKNINTGQVAKFVKE